MEKFQEQQDPDDQDQVYEVEEPEKLGEKLSTKNITLPVTNLITTLGFQIIQSVTDVNNY
jgi:hypothetical protein